jgi:hypothetical protein
MDNKPLPRFTLANILMLVVATALGLAGLRIVHDLNFFNVEAYLKAPPSRMRVERIAVYSSPILIAWTLLVLLETLRRPWPSLRQAIGHPGFVVCAAATVALIDAALYFAARAFTDHGMEPPLSMYYFNATVTLTETAGLLISGSCLALGLTGRWRLGPTWTDRFGFLVGACWLIIFLIHHGYFSVTQNF